MNAKTILETVADTYAKLSSFEVEILSTTESGDEDAFERSSQRARAFFVAPGKVRIEQSGRDGIVSVTDGVDVHHYFRRPKQYSTRAVASGFPLAGSFQPEHPLAGGTTFLFGRIAEKVVLAEILSEEPDARVILVTYHPPPHSRLAFSCSPVTFWVNTKTNLVSRMEGEMTHRSPMDDQNRTNKLASVYAHAFINQPIPPATFEYAPPAEAVDQSDTDHRPGSSSWNDGPDEKKRFETWRHSNWEDEAFVDRFELKIRGIELNFERRVTLAEQSANVSENITGTHGKTAHEYSIKIAE
jgi:outer membrane lipoprotein-sorting protein